MDVWPVSLQQRLNSSGFVKRFGNTLARTEMDIGPAKVRSRFTDAVDIYSCSVLLDYGDYTTFETFFKTTLNNGANQFEFDDPFTSSPAAFRFAEPPQITALGGRLFQIEMNWEKMP